MNPNSTIRPWLVACGSHFGANDAHEYRLPDATNRPEHSFFVYRMVKAVPNQKGRQRKHSASGSYDVYHSAEQEWTVTVRVDLFNSEDGLAELAGCCIAAADDPDIVAVLKSKGVAFKECLSVDNNSTSDDDRVFHHHTMMCTFNAWIRYEHLKTNHRITAVDSSDAVEIT